VSGRNDIPDAIDPAPVSRRGGSRRLQNRQQVGALSKPAAIQLVPSLEDCCSQTLFQSRRWTRQLGIGEEEKERVKVKAFRCMVFKNME
jgi:hypothetical protein